MFSRLIFKYNTIKCQAIMLPLRFKSYSSLKKFNSYDSKLNNSIIRSKNKIFDYAINNNFKYFITLTCKDSYNSYDLEKLNRDVSQIIRSCRKKYSTSFSYILIPEKHKKGDYHLHGLLSADFEQDFYINEHNYLSFKSFDKIGFSSIEKIRNYESCCKYITKYITKELFMISKGKHCYYCSNDLKRSEKIYDLIIHNGSTLDFDYNNDYCSLKDVSLDKVDNYLDYIFNNHFYNYYNSVTNID